METMIGYDTIRSSTETGIIALNVLKSILPQCKSIKQLENLLVSYVRKTISSRPTSAMMINVFRKTLSTFLDLKDVGEVERVKSALGKVIEEELKNAYESLNRAALIASKRIVDGDVVMTNAYSITILKTLEYAKGDGKDFRIIVAESRPGDDGHVTAKLLSKAGFKVTLIIDSAIRYFMKYATKVFVGAEAIASNGAAVSKLGTSVMALSASEARVRVFVVAGTYKLYLDTVFGELVDIPEAKPKAILSRETWMNIGEQLEVYAPLLDVTPPEYIDAIITERGLVAPQAIPLLIKEVYGEWPPRIRGVEELLQEIGGGSGDSR